MRALVLEPDGSVRLDPARAEPQPSADEALVHVRLAGVCATDLQLVRGYSGFGGVLGHEFVGEVDPADPSELAGKRVVADINIGCGTCPECRGHDPHHCRARGVVGIRSRPGVFAERVAIPRRNLVVVPASVDDELAVFAEPLAAAIHVRDDLQLGDEADPTAPVLVIGDGKLGLLIAMALHALDLPVQIVGHHDDKLELARALGIPAAHERELADQRRVARAVVEATGSPSGLVRALALVVPRGTVVLKTTLARPLELPISTIVVDELRLIGSRCGDVRRAIELLERGRIDPRPLIHARFNLSSAERALIHAGQPGVLKVLLDPRA